MPIDDELAEIIEIQEPESAFERLAHEDRIETLLVLDSDGPLPFEQLRRTVGAEDPGGFNYHLQRLQGLFVEKTDGAYALTPAGRRVVGAVRSGTFSSDFESRLIETEGHCLRCGDDLAVRLDHQGVALQCRSCDFQYNRLGIPPRAIAGHDPDSLYSLIDRWVNRWVTTALYGFCPRCDGPMSHRLLVADDPSDWGGSTPEWISDLPVEVVTEFSCGRCDEERYALVAFVAALHPTIAAVHLENGIDVRTVPLPELDWLSLGITTIDSEDPLHVRIEGAVGDETFTATFDRTLALVRFDRE